MGRPIQRKYFGVGTSGSNQIIVNGIKFADGTTATNGFIIKQTGSTAYIVQDAAMAHLPEIVFMVNATSVGQLNPGQCFITAIPFGGSQVPCAKIAQFKVSVYENGTVNSYTWGTTPPVAAGQAALHLS